MKKEKKNNKLLHLGAAVVCVAKATNVGGENEHLHFHRLNGSLSKKDL